MGGGLTVTGRLVYCLECTHWVRLGNTGEGTCTDQHDTTTAAHHYCRRGEYGPQKFVELETEDAADT